MRGVVLCKSRDVEIRILEVCMIWGGKRKRKYRRKEGIHILKFRQLRGSIFNLLV